MVQIILSEDEEIESALRRFKRKASRAWIFSDVRKIAILKLQSKNVNAKQKQRENIPEDNLKNDNNTVLHTL